MKYQYLLGIDEVGRGPIAGPVAVGAFIFLRPEIEIRKLFKGVKESKQLTELKREEWFAKIEEMKKIGHIDFAVTFQSEKIIDKKGISFAIKKALKDSLNKLIKKHSISFKDTLVLLDGGLKAPLEYIYQKTIIKGDVREMVIALASICAKVTRDRYMRKMALKYPKYGFDIHKGYGTRGHYEAVGKHGLTPLHRSSFLAKKH
jgi:ribonuclease HII